LIAERALHRRIAAVDDRDTWVCRPHSPGAIDAALRGRAFTAAHRRGKTMWLDVEDGPTLGLHLGMAGRIIVDGASEGDPAPPGERPHPGWARLTVEFEDGGRMILFDKRRLGRVVLEPDLSRLGPDAAEISREAFRERVGHGAAPVKARLLDQSVLAGVGNLLADEALWQAGIDPRRAAGTLSADELDGLRRALRSTIRHAVAHGGVHTGELIPERRREGHCPRCGTSLERATVGGRTTFWCPVDQR
jgi:formamidopyrimidine-DNA glycosylase